jgi:hypothetical protein
MSLAELNDEALAQCLPTIDSRDLILGIRHLDPREQKSLLDKVSAILGLDYAELLKLAVLQD